MSSRTAIAFIAVILAVFMAVPFFATGSDALDSGDYYITVPGSAAPEEPVYVNIENGDSQTFTLYVVNTSDKYLNVSFSYTCDTTDLTVEDLPDSVLLEPTGSKAALTSAKVVITAKGTCR